VVIQREFFIQRNEIRNEVSRPELHVDVLTIAEQLECSKTGDHVVAQFEAKMS